MKNLDREIKMDFQFMFPCIASVEINGEEIVVETETDLLRLYPLNKRVDGMVSLGEDFWGRSSFKDKNGIYYCEVDGSLYFVGSDPENDPSHPVKMEIIEEASSVDKELSEFKPFVEKVKIYAESRKELNLESFHFSLKEGEKVSQNKIVGIFKFKLMRDS